MHFPVRQLRKFRIRLDWTFLRFNLLIRFPVTYPPACWSPAYPKVRVLNRWIFDIPMSAENSGKNSRPACMELWNNEHLAYSVVILQSKPLWTIWKHRTIFRQHEPRFLPSYLGQFYNCMETFVAEKPGLLRVNNRCIRSSASVVSPDSRRIAIKLCMLAGFNLLLYFYHKRRSKML